jgi:hypothetical protein
MIETAVVFAAAGFTMRAAHNVADHVFGQTDHMAAHKADKGISGWSANLLHVFDYHVVMLIMLMITFAIFSLPLSTTGLIAGLLFSAVTHAILDRRWPVRWILEHTGSPEFAKMQTPINGMYQSDQALHDLALWVAAIMIACL